MENNLRAIALMVVSMAGFALEDMLIKFMANAGMATGQILTLLAVSGGLIFIVLARIQGVQLFRGVFWTPLMMVRNFGEAAGTVGFFTAITLSDISTASAILQAAPLAVTMGAALFLGEAVGWRRWSAIVIGFCGVLIILRPGSNGFDPVSLLAVLGVLGLSLRDVMTRAMPMAVPSMALSAYSFFILIPVGLAQTWVMGAPLVWPVQMFLPFIAASIIGVASYYALTSAMRLGETAVVTPFRYSRLIFAMGIGIFIFGESPDRWTYLGSVIVIGSGLYTLWREQRRRDGAFG